MGTAVNKKMWTREFTALIVLSALGGAASAPIGYAGRLLSTLPFLSPIFSQTLSGLHIFWLILAAIIVRRRGIGTMTGVLKGLVEAFLFSHLGILVILISTIEGVVLDSVFYILSSDSRFSIYLASGFSSASNMIVIASILQLPTITVALMFFSSYTSGIVFGGYLCRQVFKALPPNLSNIS